jgi:hypothetical protein
MFNISFFQIVLMLLLVFLLFGDFKIFITNFNKVKTFFSASKTKDIS